MSRKVTFVRFFEAIDLSGAGASVGSIGSALPPSGKTFEGLDMTVNDLGVLDVKFTFNGQYLELRFTDGIKVMRLAPEDTKAKK